MQQQLAEGIGSAREVVARVLRGLGDERLVREGFVGSCSSTQYVCNRSSRPPLNKVHADPERPSQTADYPQHTPCVDPTRRLMQCLDYDRMD
jgi:hypothetical protein